MAGAPAKGCAGGGAVTKLVPLDAAIRAHVRDGDVVYLAGFTHLIPFAAGHEIIRQGRRDLVLCRATPDLVYDQMVAAGVARKLVFSWAGNPGVGLLPALRRAVEAGSLDIEEYTHFGLVARLRAGASGLPFYPILSGPGSDLATENALHREVQCPYTGRRVPVVPALCPDVAVIHVQRADAEGNAQVWGIVGEQRDVAFAARRVIVTAEEIVPPEVLRDDPNRTLIPGFAVAAVAEAPWGAHPSYAQGYYDRDMAFYLEWDRLARDPETLRSWLDTWVFGVPDRAAYVERWGRERLDALRPAPRLSAPVNYGAYR